MSVTQSERDEIARLLTNMSDAIAERVKADNALDDFFAQHRDRVDELKRKADLCRALEAAALHAWNTTVPAATLRLMDAILSQDGAA